MSTGKRRETDLVNVAIGVLVALFVLYFVCAAFFFRPQGG